jgi:hypothetical protein
MLVRYLIFASSIWLVACGVRAEGEEEASRTFNIGPSSDPDRIRFTIPSEYLARESDLRDGLSTEPALTVQVDSFAPAHSNKRGDRRTGYLRVNWIKEGTVPSLAEGPRLSHYSVYNVPAENIYGLTRRLTQHGPFGDRSFLLVEPGGKTMIECVQLVGHVPMACEMTTEYENGLLIELGFDPVHLADWRDLRSRAEVFVRPKITFGEQTPLGW